MPKPPYRIASAVTGRQFLSAAHPGLSAKSGGAGSRRRPASRPRPGRCVMHQIGINFRDGVGHCGRDIIADRVLLQCALVLWILQALLDFAPNLFSAHWPAGTECRISRDDLAPQVGVICLLRHAQHSTRQRLPIPAPARCPCTLCSNAIVTPSRGRALAVRAAARNFCSSSVGCWPWRVRARDRFETTLGRSARVCG